VDPGRENTSLTGFHEENSYIGSKSLAQACIASVLDAEANPGRAVRVALE
jgi:hypothetical protein